MVEHGKLSNAMTGSGRTPGPWLEALPGFVTVTFVFDMFDLGQPNLVLLAMMLYGFWLCSIGAPGWRAACSRSPPPSRSFRLRCCPIWSGAGSGGGREQVAFPGIFLFVPAPIRGFERNAAEVKTWYQGMVGSSSEKGFGQRDEQNWSWVNQSLIAVTHRLVRPINYNQEDPRQAAAHDECHRRRLQDGELDRAGAVGVARTGFVAVMPPASAAYGALGRRGARHPVLPDDGGIAAGAAILFHVAVLPDDGADASCRLRRAAERAPGNLARPGAAGILMLLALPWFPNVLQAWGNNLVATAMLAAGLAWHIRHPPVAAGPRPWRDAGSATT